MLEKVNFPGLEAVSLPCRLASVAGERECLFLWGVSGTCVAGVRACLCVNRADGVWRPCECEAM